MNINYADSCNFKPIPAITPLDNYWQNSTWKFNMPEITAGTSSQPSWQDIILSGNTALTLTNALANGLNYLKLFGGTEQRNIPSGFTQVEYLESSGTQYIDTGIVPTGAYTVIAKAKYNDLGSGSSKLFGSRNGNGSKEFIFTAGSLNGAVFTIGYGTNTITATGVDSNTNIHIFKLSKGTGYVDNTIAKQFTQESFTGDYSIYLFGANYAGTENGLSSTRFYYEEIYDGNDALVQKLIPCRRNSDSVLGMYDTVSGNFLTNSGTGTFTAGADVTTPSPDYPMDIVCNNGVLKVSPNLFDKNDVNLQNRNRKLTLTKDGYWYYADGSTSLACSCLPNTQYTISGISSSTTILRVATIDVDTLPSQQDTNDIPCSYIYRTTQSEVHTFVTPSTAKWIIVQVSAATFDSTLNTIQIEQGSTATTYMPYGQVYVDSKSKNLFDYEYFYDNYQIYSTSSVGRCPIKLQPNTTYTVSTNKEIVATNTSSIFVVSGSAIDWTPSTANNGVLVNSPRTVTTDSNGYLCFGLYMTSENAIPESDFVNGVVWVQIEQGSSATPYVPYYNTTETVEITGKNLFDVDNNLLEGYYIDGSSGNLLPSQDGSSSCFKDFLPSRPNLTYTMSRINVSSSTRMRMWAYDKDKNPISLVFNSLTDSIKTTGTTPNGTAYVRCSFGSIPLYNQNIQLELGSTATTYEPYFNGGSATAENLFKVGDYKDTQEVLSGNVTRNFGIKVVDGTEDWRAHVSLAGWFQLSEPLVYGGIAPALCTHYPYSPAQGATGVYFSTGRNTPQTNRILIADNVNFPRTNMLAEFKQYLATQYANGTPVIIVYPLATATTESVTGQPLTIQAGTNIVEITQASIENLGLEVSFKQSTI